MNDNQSQKAGSGSNQFQIHGDLIFGVTEDRAVELANRVAEELLGDIRRDLEIRWNARLTETICMAAERHSQTPEQLLRTIRDNPETHEIFIEALDAARKTNVRNKREGMAYLVSQMTFLSRQFRDVSHEDLVVHALADLEGQHIRVLLQFGRAWQLPRFKQGVDIDQLCLALFRTNTLATPVLGTLSRHRLIAQIQVPKIGRQFIGGLANGTWSITSFGGNVLDYLDLSGCGGIVHEDAIERLFIEGTSEDFLRGDNGALDNL